MKNLLAFAIWIFPALIAILLLFWLAPDTTRNVLRSLRSLAGAGDEFVETVTR
jgi:hypothetical protein